MGGIDHVGDRRAGGAVVHVIEDATDVISGLHRHVGREWEWEWFSPMSFNGKWTTGHIPDQRGRVAIVTGANTGLGYHTAAALAQAGAQVILAVRALEK